MRSKNKSPRDEKSSSGDEQHSLTSQALPDEPWRSIDSLQFLDSAGKGVNVPAGASEQRGAGMRPGPPEDDDDDEKGPLETII